ncbi:MAG: outer membrane beta-barrel protein [Salaquimonas sp.]
MKSFLKNGLTAFALALPLVGVVVGNANAADLSTATDGNFVEPQYDPVQNSSIWNGAYAGLYGGLNWKSVGVMGSGDVDINKQKDIGGYVGINQALGDSIIGGLEWMGGFSGKESSANGNTAKQDWETSLRARMGYAVEQNLIYGLAGVTATQLELSDPTGSDTKLMTGWTVGAGIERQFTDHITGRLEYDYSQYGDRKFDLGAGPTKADISGHGMKVGLGYKF